jgi:membrane protease YdiL (CAAX protease family)
VLLPIVASVQTLVDTGLRMSLSTGSLRNLRAVISVFGMLPLLLALAMATRETSFMFDVAAALPAWLDYLPAGLAVRAIAAADGAAAAPWLALAMAQSLAVVAIGYALVYRQLRHGVVAGGAREGVARLPRAARHAPAPSPGAQPRLSAVQRRELVFLGRDRTFMAQTLVVPIVMVGAQVFINAGGNVFAGAVEHPETLAAIAFGLAAYTLMTSAFQALNAEGRALWILYCIPRPLEFVLWQKAKLWGAVATLYAALAFAGAVVLAGHLTLQFVGLAAIVLAGVPIFAVIATALGVFGCDPLAKEVQRRVRVAYVYLYMLLASLYVYALYATTLWQRAALMVLTALLAAALWQKARDQFDYLLDPSASPRPRVSVSDGMIAALMFFVLQGLIFGFLRATGADIPAATMIWIAFSAAGAVTYSLVRFVYWRAGTEGVPRIFGQDVPRALTWGVLGGIAAAVAGVAYIGIGRSLDLLPVPPHPGFTAGLWIVGLAVVAAPLFEEFIFRGLIFGGLRRSLGPIAATLASAAIFAIVHPPGSVIPVFVMAVCAAFVYARTRMLAAPMLVHAIYNAAVLGFQWGAMG